MNILFTRFPLESAYGGAEVQTLSLMEGLQKRGHSVEFLGSCPTLLSECQRRQLPHRKLIIGPPPVTKWLAISFFWNRFSMKKKLINTLRSLNEQRATSNEQPCILIMLSLSEKLLLTEWAVDHGYRVIWTEHDRIGRWFTHNPWFPQLRRLAHLATTVTVSELSRSKLQELGWPAENTIAIPNGVQEAAAIPRAQRSEKDPLRMLCVARLTHDKGIDILVHAVAGVPNAYLTIVGQGRDEAQVKQNISCSVASQRIALQPQCPDISAAYANADVVVLPSRKHDPFGMVIAEAMMRGIPTIVTTACGIAGYLTNDVDALIVPAGNEAALRQALASMCFPRVREKLSSHGRMTAVKLFSVDTMIERYVSLLGKNE